MFACHKLTFTKLKRNRIYVTLFMSLFYSCNLDYPPSTTSTSIDEAKKNGFFLFEYKIDSLKILDKKKTFVVRHVWLEKAHTSTMSTLGVVKYHITEGMNQVVFDLGRNGYFTPKNEGNWIIEDEKGDLNGTEGDMVDVGLNYKMVPEHIRFNVYALKTPTIINYDRVKVAEFILKRKL